MLLRAGYHRAQSQRLLDEAVPSVPDASRVKPDDGRGKHDHRPVLERTFLVAGGQPTPLCEPVDTARHDVAPRVDRLVEDEWTTRSRRALRSLVTSLGNRMLALP